MADLTAKLLGYRYWTTDGADYYDDEDEQGCGLLYSQGYKGWAWGLGVNEAQCSNGAHEAPVHGCQCGLHAYYAPQVAAKRGPFKSVSDEVYGCVRAWGRMEVHHNGYRAQFAEIVALAYNEHLPRRYQNIVKALARDYEVECVPLSKLTAFALEQADPMPAELIPEKPAPAQSSDQDYRFGGLLASMQQQVQRQMSSQILYGQQPTFTWSSASLAPAAPSRPEDIGLHSAEPGDILKFGQPKPGEPPF